MEHDKLSAQEGDHIQSNKSGAGPTRGVGRILFSLGFTIYAFLLAVFITFSKASPSAMGPMLVILVNIAFAVICYLRLKNIGKSAWLCLLLLVPAGAIILGVMGAILPRNYNQTRKLDAPGKITGCVFLAAIFVLIMLALS